MHFSGKVEKVTGKLVYSPDNTTGMKTLLTLFGVSLTIFVSAQNFFIAHRGASYDAPENTMASVKLAWEVGAEAAEVDVHLSADHRVMVIHDKNTKRTCGGKSYILKDTPSEILRELDAGSWKDSSFSGERIPFLEEVMATIPEGKILVVEIKCGSEIIPWLEQIMANSPLSSRIIFIAFDWETIVKTKKTFPANKAYWLSGDKKNALMKLPAAAESGLDGLNLHYSAIDAETIAAARGYELEVWVWTVDQPEEAKRLTGLGVRHLTTNRPDWLKQQLK